MATSQPSSVQTAAAVVVDANIGIAMCTNEPGAANASTAVNQYVSQRFEFYAPGAILAETLYVLCGKLQDGILTAAEHMQAIQDFALFMRLVRSPPHGEGSLVLRAEAVRGTYTCRRSSDGIYIALAEELAASRPTTLLTFDEKMGKQTAREAPSVTVHLVTV